MGKCESCQNNKCGRKYENRHKCDYPKTCTCTCNEDPVDTGCKGWLSGIGGVAAVVGGIALTVATGGVGGVLVGGILTGVGATAVMHPVEKKISGEKMTGTEYVKDLAIGSITGAASAGVSSVGTALTTKVASCVGSEFCKQGVTKLGVRTAVGVVSGATSAAIQEKASDDENINWKNVGISIVTGGLSGGLGHASGNILNKVSTNGIARGVTRVTSEVVNSALIDSSQQLMESGNVDFEKMASRVCTKAVLHTASEGSKNTTLSRLGGRANVNLLRAEQYDAPFDIYIPSSMYE